MNPNSNPGQPIRNIDEKPLIQTGPALNNQISQNINQTFEKIHKIMLFPLII